MAANGDGPSGVKAAEMEPASETGGLSRRRLRRGVALLIVLLLSLVMIVVVFSFQRVVTRAVLTSSNIRDDLRAAYYARMGLEKGKVMLRLDEQPTYDSLNEDWTKPPTWEGETFGSGEGEESSGDPPSVLVTDEERKFNLLLLVRGSEQSKERAQEVLTRLIGICRRQDDRLELSGESRSVRRADDDTASTETLVTNLVRYLGERASEDGDDLEISFDPNEEPDKRGIPKQSPYEMLTIGELLQVEGWTEELLYGPPKVARSSREEENDEPVDPYAPEWELTEEERFERKREAIESVDERSQDPDPIGLFPFITLYSSGPVNINTAPREVILALSEDLTWEIVEELLTAREADRQDVEEAEETGSPPLPEETEEGEDEDKASFRAQDLQNYAAFLQRVTGEADGTVEGLTEEVYNEIRPWLVVTSRVFSIEAFAKSGKVSSNVRAVYLREFIGEPQGNQPPPTPGDPPVPDNEGEGDGTPPEPDVNLTLLFMDTSTGR